MSEQQPTMSTPPPSLRSVAFYLPQFHPIPENDEWWGKGYTEWQRVVSARPQFRGHLQPHLPADLGFYDLRVPEVRQAQADLAAQYRIDAFCYYYYWFSGRRLLHRPLDEVLTSGEPKMPFAICWANEPWTRAWDGRDRAVLLPQTTLPDDPERFAQDLISLLADPRYLRVHGRPLILVYRACLLPDARRATDVWRQVITRAGIPEPFVCRVESFPEERGDPASLGFDGAVEFQPDWAGIERPRTPLALLGSARRRARSVRTFVRGHRVIPYDHVVEFALSKQRPDYHRWPCVTPGWDNTARRDRGATIVHGSTPASYERWVRDAAKRSIEESNDPLLFVNAWNEWGEGCHLEPDRNAERAFLEAHRRGVDAVSGLSSGLNHGRG